MDTLQTPYGPLWIPYRHPINPYGSCRYPIDQWIPYSSPMDRTPIDPLQIPYRYPINPQ